MVIGLVIVFVLLRRPKPDRPATWAECMAGAVGMFALIMLAYAVIPHECITFSDKYLQWDTTKFVFRSDQDMLVLGIVELAVQHRQAGVRDIIVVGIYVVFFGLNLVLFVMWQKRGTEEAARPRRRRRCRASAGRCGARRSRHGRRAEGEGGDA